MQKIILIFLTFIFLSYGRPVAAEGSIDYFPHIKEQEIPDTLERIGVKNCEEFLAKFFNTESKSSEPDKATRLLMQAAAYETGLCIDQDLFKAKDAYEESFKSDPSSVNVSAKLALIYSYGPPELRDPQQASFYMKQSAITLRLLYHMAIKAAFGFNPIPDTFQKELKWVDDILQKDTEERKAIALDLKEKNYRDTELIWDPADAFYLQPD